MAFCCLALSGGLAGALAWQSTQGTIMPYVVEVNELGQAQAVAPATADYRPTDPQIAFHLARFIENVRQVPADPIVLRQSWLRAYDFTTDRGALALNDYARVNDPYPYSAGALYQVYLSPGQVTDIALQPGESLVGNGPIAAGDTARWIIGDTISGSGDTQRTHILVKPTRPDIVTNLVINTDRRTYHLELRAHPSAYMASVSWRYPEDELIALRRNNRDAETALPIGRDIALDALRFRYRIEGDRPPWRPRRAFDDGRQVFIEFPRGIGQGEMPPLFVIGPEGEGQLVNYRIRRNYIIVDRLFAAAELRLGDRQQVVRIVRTDGVRRSPRHEDRGES